MFLRNHGYPRISETSHFSVRLSLTVTLLGSITAGQSTPQCSRLRLHWLVCTAPFMK